MVGPDYFIPAPSDATERPRAIVLLTDIFGLRLPNPRIIANHFTEHVGVDVWVPDYFNGAFSLISWYAFLVVTEPRRTLPSGKLPMDANELEPLIPDRDGV